MSAAELLLTTLLSIGSAAMTGVLTFRTALKKFREEKWWEKKFDTYEKLFSKIHTVVYCANLLTEQTFQNSEEGKLMMEEHEVAIEELQRLIGVGSFLLSDKANALLKKARDASVMDSSFTNEFTVWKGNLEKLAEAAREDLRLPSEKRSSSFCVQDQSGTFNNSRS